MVSASEAPEMDHEAPDIFYTLVWPQASESWRLQLD